MKEWPFLLVSSSTILSISDALTNIEAFDVFALVLRFLQSSSKMRILSFDEGKISETNGEREFTAPCGVKI